MHTGTRKHLTAWLGLLAMLLIGCVPLASQLVAASHTGGEHMICSTAATGAPAHAGSMDPADACGYCSFFDHYTSLPTSFAAPARFLRLLIAFTASASTSAPALLKPYPSGCPRAPPGTR